MCLVTVLHPEDMFAASFMHVLCYVMFMHAASEQQVSGQRGPKRTPRSIQRDPMWDIGLGCHGRNPFVRFQSHLVSFKQFTNETLCNSWAAR